MKFRTLVLAAGLALGVAACGGGGDSLPEPPPPAPPPPPPVVFSDFVKQQFAATADDTDPVEVDGTDFVFLDLGNSNAYDDLLSANP